MSSSQIHYALSEIGEHVSLVTVKRELTRMTASGLLAASGKGRSRAHKISAAGRIFSNVNASAYCAREPDRRYGLVSFNFDLLAALPPAIFTPNEYKRLEDATQQYHQRTSHLPPAIEKKELERLIIELSWKSSKIEGNTYTLLDTEKLILEHKEAAGHDSQS